MVGGKGVGEGKKGGLGTVMALRVFFLRACNDKQLVIQVEF